MSSGPPSPVFQKADNNQDTCICRYTMHDLNRKFFIDCGNDKDISQQLTTAQPRYRQEYEKGAQ